MEWRGRHTKLLTEGIALIFILLFVYTGINKIWDVNTFQAQMAQSEMLRPHTAILSWAVPIIELTLAGLLLSNYFIRSLVMGREEEARDFLAHTTIDVYHKKRGINSVLDCPLKTERKSVISIFKTKLLSPYTPREWWYIGPKIL